MGQETHETELQGLLKDRLIQAGVREPEAIVEKWRLDLESEIVNAARTVRQLKPALDSLKARACDDFTRSDQPAVSSLQDVSALRNAIVEMEGRLDRAAGRLHRGAEAMSGAIAQSGRDSDRVAEDVANMRSMVARLEEAVVSKGRTLIWLVAVALGIGLSTAVIGVVIVLVGRG